MNQTNKITAALCLALTGSLMFSCADSRIDKKNNTINPAGAPVEETETIEKAEPAVAQLTFAVTAEFTPSMTLSISIPNSQGELETLVKTNARRTVMSNNEGYDYFLSGEGEIKQVTLLRNDDARIAIAYVVTKQETLEAIGTAALKGYETKELYDAIYMFELGDGELYLGTFDVKMDSEGLFVAAAEMGLTAEELTEMVEVAVLGQTEITTVAEIIDTIKAEVRPEQEAPASKEVADSKDSETDVK